MAKNIYVLLSAELSDFFTNLNSSTKLISWTDNFSEGPILANVRSDDFWMKRYAYAEKQFKIPHLAYYETNIKPIINLQDLAEVEEVVFWHTNTLASTFNLLAIGSYVMESYRKDVRFTLVNLTKQKLENFEEIDFDIEKEKKGVKITRNNLLFLHNCWLTLVNNSVNELQLNDFKHAKFPFLKNQISKYIQNQ